MLNKVLSSLFAVLRKSKIRNRLAPAGQRTLTTCSPILQLRTSAPYPPAPPGGRPSKCGDSRRGCPPSETPLRWSSALQFILAFSALVTVSHAQQIDFAVGGSTLWSSKPLTASQAFLPPAESGGVLAGASLQYLTERRFGLNVEGAFRAKQGLYNGYQFFRPAFYDVNAVMARRFAPRIRADFMAGVGGETLLFYQTTNCIYNGSCHSYVNDTHFLIHAGVGVRYYLWKTFFVRPEAHYYFIPNNSEFHSDHVFRVGASIGHTFGSH